MVSFTSCLKTVLLVKDNQLVKTCFAGIYACAACILVLLLPFTCICSILEKFEASFT